MIGVEIVSQQLTEPPSAQGRDPGTDAETNLARARRGDVFVVVRVVGDDLLARSLVAAGLWTGARIEWIGRAPFGDPLLFRVHGYRLALRASEAERVRVTRVEAKR